MIYIKHERFMDIAIKLSAPIRRTRTGYQVTGKYVNMGFVETFELGVPVSITIAADKISNWQVCENPTEKSIRKSNWRPAKWKRVSK
jgi:hypothetical protein